MFYLLISRILMSSFRNQVNRNSIRLLLRYVPTYLDLLVGFSAHIYYTDWIALLKSIDLDSKDSDGQVREYD